MAQFCQSQVLGLFQEGVKSSGKCPKRAVRWCGFVLERNPDMQQCEECPEDGCGCRNAGHGEAGFWNHKLAATLDRNQVICLCPTCCWQFRNSIISHDAECRE